MGTKPLFAGRGESTADDIDRPREFEPARLVGRVREMQTLAMGLDARPSVVSVQGEAGIGKTRLVQEALRGETAPRVRRLWGSFQPIREPFPLGAVIGAFRGLGGVDLASRAPLSGVLHPLLPELREGLAPPIEPFADSAAERHRVFRALIEVLDALGPTILVLEDLHWADPMTFEFLILLLADLPTHLGLVVTYRDEDLRPAPVGLSRVRAGARRVHIDLDPLDAPSVGKMVSGMLDTPQISAEFQDFVFRCTAGIPFAVEELVRLLRDREDLISREGQWVRHELNRIQVPPAIRDSVLERVRRLDPDTQGVISAAAVLGEEADEDLLSAVALLSAAAMTRALSAAMSTVLHDDGKGGVRFRHALSRQAVYDAIPPPERRALHRRAGLALEARRPERVGQLALHFSNSGLTERWADYAERAADAASALGNHVVAYAYLQELLAADVVVPDHRAAAGQKLADAALEAVAHVEAAGVLQKLIEDPTTPEPSRAELRAHLGRLLMPAGEVGAAVAVFIEAERGLAHRPDLAARVASTVGSPWVGDLTMDEHLTWLKRAESLARRTHDPDVTVFVEVDHAATLVSLGHHDAWAAVERLHRPGASRHETRQLARGLLNAAYSAVMIGYDERARRLLAEAAVGADAAMSSQRFDGLVRSCQLLLDWEAGRWAELKASAHDLIDECVDRPNIHIDASVVLGLHVLAQGDVTAGEELLNEACAAALSEREVALACLAAGALSRLDLARGNPQLALGRLREPMESLRRREIWAWGLDAVPPATAALLATGDRNEATALVATFADGVREIDAPAADAAVLVCRAQLIAETEPNAAGELFDAAARMWTQLGRPYRSAMAAEAAGSVLSEARSVGSLQAALQTYRSLGAAWDVDRVRARLRRRGIQVKAKSGRKSYGMQLSPREREVATLASDGHTNRDIAEQLFLSVKTVEKHVSAVLRKLDIDSRNAIAATLDR